MSAQKFTVDLGSDIANDLQEEPEQGPAVAPEPASAPASTPAAPQAQRPARSGSPKTRRRMPRQSHEEWQRIIDQATRKKRAADQKAAQRAEELEQIITDAKTQVPAPLVEAWRVVAFGVGEDQSE